LQEYLIITRNRIRDKQGRIDRVDDSRRREQSDDGGDMAETNINIDDNAIWYHTL
jgi:hypothetical protein